MQNWTLKIHGHHLCRMFNFESSKFTLNFTNTNISGFLVLSRFYFFLGDSRTCIYFLLVELKEYSKRFEKPSEIWECWFDPKLNVVLKWRYKLVQNNIFSTCTNPIIHLFYPPLWYCASSEYEFSLLASPRWLANQFIKILAFALARLSLVLLYM